MKVDPPARLYGEIKEIGQTEVIDGTKCDIVKMHFPVADGGSGADKWAWYTAYRFTTPGWPECTIVGLAAAKRVIQGRTDPAVINTLGIDPYTEKSERTSVLSAIRENRNKPRAPRTDGSIPKGRDYGRDD